MLHGSSAEQLTPEARSLLHVDCSYTGACMTGNLRICGWVSWRIVSAVYGKGGQLAGASWRVCNFAQGAALPA